MHVKYHVYFALDVVYLLWTLRTMFTVDVKHHAYLLRTLSTLTKEGDGVILRGLCPTVLTFRSVSSQDCTARAIDLLNYITVHGYSYRYDVWCD